MRVGVIGLGSIGRRHVGNLLALGCEVYGFDSDTRTYQRAKDEHRNLITNAVAFNGRMDGTPYLDAVVIATPWNTHLDWVEWAIERRLPMFIEKPLGSLEQLPRWRAIAARQLIPIHQVGYQLRFHPIAQRMRDECALSGAFHAACYMRTWPGGFYGPMLLEMSHEIDLALWCGAPAAVTRVTGEASHLTIALGISWSVTLESEAAQYRRAWSVFHRTKSYQYAVESPIELGDQMYVDEMAHFLECVRENKPTSVPLSEGLKVLEVCAQVEAMRQVPA